MKAQLKFERSFHFQGEIKTKKRDPMATKSLSDRMKIVIHGPSAPSDTFFEKILRRFKNKNKQYKNELNGGKVWNSVNEIKNLEIDL